MLREGFYVIRLIAFLSWTVCVIGLSGCSNGPPRAEAPDWSPSSMASAAIEQLDASGDSQVDRDEVLAAPGLMDAFEILDTDSSGTLSESEIEARFRLYEELREAFITTRLRIHMNGRPLRGAFVKLIPEAFQGDSLLPASGTTDDNGQVSPRTEGKPFPAMQPGFFRVELYRDESAKEPIVVKSPLGVESTPLARADRNMIAVLNFQAGK